MVISERRSKAMRVAALKVWGAAHGGNNLTQEIYRKMLYNFFGLSPHNGGYGGYERKKEELFKNAMVTVTWLEDGELQEETL